VARDYFAGKLPHVGGMACARRCRDLPEASAPQTLCIIVAGCVWSALFDRFITAANSLLSITTAYRSLSQ